MSLDALRAGLGERLAVRDASPSSSTRSSARGTAINVGALVGHTPRAPLRDGRGGDRARGDARTRSRAMRAHRARGARGRRARLRDVEVADARRLRGPARCRAARRRSPRSQALAGCLGECRPRRHAGDDRPRPLPRRSSPRSRSATGKPVIVDRAARRACSGPTGTAASSSATAKLQSEGIARRAAGVVPAARRRVPVRRRPSRSRACRCFGRSRAADSRGQEAHLRRPGVPRAFRERVDARPRSARAWDDIVISECAGRARARRSAASPTSRRERGVDPVDLVLDLALATDLEARFRIAVANTDEDEVAELLAHPAPCSASPTPARTRASSATPARRPTCSAHWVREKRRAHARGGACGGSPSRPPTCFGIRDRGRLAAGLAADVTVFDPDDRRLLARCAACATSRPAPTASSPTRSGIRAVDRRTARRSARTAATRRSGRAAAGPRAARRRRA